MCSVRFGQCSAPWECSVRLHVRVRCSCSCTWSSFKKIYKFYPWETCVFFAEFANITPFFLNMCVFHEYLVNLCVFRGNLVNYLENLQIPPLGNVRLFRRIRKNDGPFLKTCVFFTEFAEINMFRRN